MHDDIKTVLVSEEQLKAKVAELGAQISRDYAGKNLVLVSILKGSVVFMADLMRAVSIPCSIDFMVVSSYGGSNTTTSGLVKIIKDLDGDLSGKDVLIVEDILDTGITLSNLVPMLKMRNPYRDEMASLSLDQLPDRQNRIAAIYTFLKQKISWNGQYGLYGNEVKKAVKNGTGSNADINFILMSMLRDAQIPCYPAVMSRKDRGILPYSYPSIQKLNTFIVGIADTDSTLVFLDGSVINGYMNTLPPVLMVNRARLISETAGGRWMNLSKLGKNQIRATVRAQIHPDGQITGDRNAVYMGQYAANLRRRYYAAKDSTEYINQLETEENIKVKKFETRELNVFSPRITEFLDFEKQATVNDDLIYVNPMIFLHVSKCPFIQTERQLPLEMPYTEHILQATMLTIPEGYAVEELPKPLNLKTEDGQDIVRYNISQSGNTINVTYTFIANKLLHLATEYPTVKMFWENVAEKNNELIVLKKQ